MRGFLDKVDMKKVGAYETQWLAHVKDSHAAILSELQDKHEISPELDEKVRASSPIVCDAAFSNPNLFIIFHSSPRPVPTSPLPSSRRAAKTHFFPTQVFFNFSLLNLRLGGYVP